MKILSICLSLREDGDSDALRERLAKYEEACPEHLPVPRLLESVAKEFEKNQEGV